METYTAGELIRQFRESEGLTQEELADIIHVSQQKLAHWEEGSTIPKPTMVARLTGALRLSDENANRLVKAVDAAQAVRDQDKAAAQAVINAQNEEIERLRHKRKVLTLLGFGALGFIGGCIFVFATGSHKDTVWYFPMLIGIAVAGIPYGWNLLTDKTEVTYKEPYSPYPEVQRENMIIKLIFFVLKFIGAYLIGIIAFPVVLLYHAYKAGRKGSAYRAIMFFVFIAVCLLIGSIIVVIFMNSTK